jgi:hypothetical protein
VSVVSSTLVVVVEQTLLERVLRLDGSSRLELWAAIDASFDDGTVDPEVAMVIDQRLATVRAHPRDYLSLDEFEREVNSRA